jgi:hypothetical protein
MPRRYRFHLKLWRHDYRELPHNASASTTYAFARTRSCGAEPNELLVAVLCNDACAETVAVQGVPAKYSGRLMCDIHTDLTDGTVCSTVTSAGPLSRSRWRLPARKQRCCSLFMSHGASRDMRAAPVLLRTLV